jgi:tetratricopeptide (TPR) repeat protein
MEFKRATCPSCSGVLQLPSDRTEVQCMYCGTQIVVQRAIAAHAGPTIANFLQLASASARASNYAEAYRYYSQVLELDPASAVAWYGRAIAAGLLSTTAAPRLREMTTGIADALERTTPAEVPIVRQRAAVDVNFVCSHYLRLVAKETSTFGAAPWNAFCAHATEVMNALEAAIGFDPNNHVVLESYLNLITQLLTGRDTYDLYLQGMVALRVAPDFDAALRAKYKELNGRYVFLQSGRRF